MNVTAFVGSARKKHTYHAAEQFIANLQTRGPVESEIVSGPLAVPADSLPDGADEYAADA